MDRRSFLKLSAAGVALNLIPNIGFSQEVTGGKLFINLVASGGWDTTMFCDPKENVDGNPVISNWSKTAKTMTAGNIKFAPIGNNSSFFQKYYNSMLVINGVDVSTVNHSVGRVYASSGKLARSHPTLAALNAGLSQQDLALPFMSSLDYKNTKNIVQGLVLSNSTPTVIGTAANPNYEGGNSLREVYQDNEVTLLKTAESKLLSLSRAENHLPGDAERLRDYTSVVGQHAKIGDLSERYDSLRASSPAEIEDQYVFLMAALSGGYCSSSDLRLSGFDSHTDNDTEQQLALDKLTTIADYIWVTAEQEGIADKLILMLSSDFSRTPSYNVNNGKDHWPVGSFIVMSQENGFGNRVIGTTDLTQKPNLINPNTLLIDQENGVKITPEHVHYLVRDKLGLNNSSIANKYNLGSFTPLNV